MVFNLLFSTDGAFGIKKITGGVPVILVSIVMKFVFQFYFLSGKFFRMIVSLATI